MLRPIGKHVLPMQCVWRIRIAVQSTVACWYACMQVRSRPSTDACMHACIYVPCAHHITTSNPTTTYGCVANLTARCHSSTGPNGVPMARAAATAVPARHAA